MRRKHRPFEIGDKVGRLTITGPSDLVPGRAARIRFWPAQCDCGSVLRVRNDALRSGNTKSCGCVRRPTPATAPGQRFGRLVVLRETESRRTPSGTAQRWWWVRCDCGTEKAVRDGGLRGGDTRSCGCMASELTVSRQTRHGQIGTSEYKAWCDMKTRCLRPSVRAYANYGGRGIRVCDEWLHDFAAFLTHIGPRPAGATLDRIDVNGNYEPGNVRWATWTRQARNKRNNRLVTAFGLTLCVADWAGRTGLRHGVLRTRLALGWSAEAALSEPVRRGMPLARRADHHTIAGSSDKDCGPVL